jgi:kynurenine formamidase
MEMEYSRITTHDRGLNDAPWWPSRYGADDQIGTLNEITPSKVVAATKIVREGTVYDLGRTLHANVPRFEGRFWQQTLISSAHIFNSRRPDAGAHGWGRNNVNWITELVTGTFQIGTQLDGLNHLQIGDRFYNGYLTTDIVEEWGTSKLGIETVPPVITRGVLADVARYRGVDRLDAGYVITVEDLEGTLRSQGVAAGAGDVLLFHTGWGSLWETDHTLFNSGEPGIGMAVAEWIVERGIAMTGADTWSYGAVPGEDLERPFVVPQALNVKHGVFVMENLATEVLAQPRVYEFMFVLTHHKTRGSTAAVIAPAAVV